MKQEEEAGAGKDDRRNKQYAFDNTKEYESNENKRVMFIYISFFPVVTKYL